MFFQFVGLSLFVHLFIILSAKLINYVRGHEHKHKSAYQTYNKNGGVVAHHGTNRLISVAILLFTLLYMVALSSVAIVTALKVGSDEPQVIFYKHYFGKFFEFIMVLPQYPMVLMFIVGALMVWLFSKNRNKLNESISITMNNATFIRFYKTLVAFLAVLGTTSEKVFQRLQSKTASIYSFFQKTVQKIEPILSHGSALRVSITLALPIALGIVVGIVMFSLPLWAEAQIIEPGFESEVVVNNLNLATAVAFSNDGRIFIAEKSGVVKVVKNGVLLATPLLTLTDVNTFGDRGLLGLAVDPNFATNGFIYLSYSYENTPGLNIAGSKTGRIVRMTVVGDTASESTKLVLVGTQGGDALLPSCEDYIITTDCIPSDSNSHSVGGLRFGPDGKLYATLGDGADFTDVDPRALRAQNVDSLGGKMLRINTDGTAPIDNPFYNGDPNANRSKVYALGLRNSFRFNFHPTTGVLLAGDVGWSSYEEINKITAGGNYGWPCREGTIATTYGCTPSSTAIDPVYAYAHNSTGAGSVTSGAFMSNGAYPGAYANTFFIGDYAQMWMKKLELTAAGAFVSVSDFNVDNVWPVEIIAGEDGHVYYIDIVLGTLNRLTHTNGNRRPIVSLSANPTSGLSPLNVNFSTTGTNDPDGDALSYSWQFGDGATSVLPNPSHTYTSNGAYSASVVVSDTFGASGAMSTAITVGNQKPTATIVTPSSGALYQPLADVLVSATGFDPETGDLPSSAFSWEVILHHNVHTHTIQQFTGTKNINFVADNHNDSDVYLEILLTVTDNAGLTDVTSINMYLDNGVGSGNLVSNPSVEIAGAVTSSPNGWYQGWYGVLNPIFTYPVAGFAGTKGARIDILSYSNGNAKWYFSPAFVSGGETYNFSNLYTANVPTKVTVQFGKPDGTYQYLFLGEVVATSTPTRTNFSFVVPVGVETATVFHELDAVGNLVVDDYILTLQGSGDVVAPSGSITTPVSGVTVSDIVSVTVDAQDNVGVASVRLTVDGVLVGVGDSEAPYNLFLDTTTLTGGTHTLGALVLDTAGNQTQTPTISIIVDNATPINLITNGDFEITNGLLPLGWQKGGWGTHTRVLTYPVPGSDGGVGAETAITSYNFNDTGDAKWQFDPVAVTSGTQYTYESMYKSNSISDVIGRYTMSNGTVHYFGLIKELQPVANWTHIQNTFIPPVGATSVTFFHLISSVATVSIDEVKLYVSGSGTPAETNAPAVAFLNPTAGAVVSGVVTLTASSSDDTSVVGVYFAVNGIFQGVEDATSPYQTTWDTTLVPNGTYVLKATSHDPYGNNNKTEITVTVNNTTPSPDTTKPTVSVTSPIGGTTASGTMNVAITATDNIGVTGVTLLIDGVIVGVQDTTLPYTFVWNTTGVTNGAHTISARASDAAGNSQDAVAVSITVNNSVVVPPSNNLVLNPALETPGTTGNPANWNRGGWGTNNRLFTYPTTGVTGSGAQVEITTFTNGDAKWYFDPVTVTPNTQYTVGDRYNSTVASEILVRYTLTGGAFSYQFLSQLPATGGVWNTFSQSITTPANATALTLFHVIASNGRLTIDDATVLGQIVPPSDTIPPVVGITPIGTSSPIVGTVVVTASNATDNVAVEGVSLLVDGVIVGTQDTTSPYSFTFDSTTVTNGAHTLSLRATDTSGNTADAVVTVDVQNIFVPPSPSNLITNGDFETVGTAGNPANWNRGGWGTNTRVFTYPSAGQTGNGAQLDITSYTDGDAKWYFNPVSVTPGNQYTFNYKYKSSVGTNITLRYTMVGGGFTYVGVANPNASASWISQSLSFIPPTNATEVTVMHILNKVGSLSIDEQVLFTGNLNTFNRGKVSFSFDDGWVEHSTIAQPILDSAGIDGTFYIISDEMLGATPTERIVNNTLETTGTLGNPANWNQGGWGTNTRTYTYPVSGVTGSGAQIDVTTYTDGDAKWYADPSSVIASTTYLISGSYKSTAPSEVLVRYTLQSGAFSYQFLTSLPSSSNTWQTYAQSVKTPVDATQITVFHVLATVGVLTIDNQSVKQEQEYATVAQVQALQASGHEIGAHTKTHPQLTSLSNTNKQIEIGDSKDALIAAGLNPIVSIAYPYGSYDEDVQTITQNNGFTSGRSVDRGFNDTSTDPYALKIQQISRPVTLQQMTNWVDQASATNTWLIFMFHQISSDANETLGISITDFEDLVNYTANAAVDILTVSEGRNLMP